MKIKRQDCYEQNKTSVFWLNEFGYDLEKNADHLDYLKLYLEKKYKTTNFKSIDEKLADIKDRVGFDLARKISDEIEKTSSACACVVPKVKHSNCECKVKVANSVHSKDDVECMKNILSYIKSLVSHERHLSSIAVLERCKQEDGLKFNELPIDIGKLKDHIDKLLKQYDVKSEKVTYHPPVSMHPSEAEDTVAEYYHHAEPSLS